MVAVNVPISAIPFLPGVPLSVSALTRAAAPDPMALYGGDRHPLVALGTVAKIEEPKKINSGALEEPTVLLDLEHCGVAGALGALPVVEEIGSSRVSMTGADLATTKLRPYLGKTVAIPEGETIGSPEWACITVDTSILHPGYLHAILLGRSYRSLASDLSTGQQHPRVSVDTLRRMRIPLPPLDVQKVLSQRVETLRSELDREPGLDVLRSCIDHQFQSRIGLDPARLSPAPSPRCLEVSLAEVAASRDTRFSWKHHAPESRIARQDLKAISGGPLAGFLQRGSELGQSATPELDYTTGSGFSYLTMASLSRWVVDPTPCPELNDDYVERNADRCVEPGDILMARSGEGTIGKVGIVREGTEGCFADFVIRMRADPSKLSPEFLRYMLMTAHYQTLIAAEKKGLGNNTNIFPIQIDVFPMIDASLAQQREIVESISDTERRIEAARARAIEIEDEMEDVLRDEFSAH